MAANEAERLGVEAVVYSKKRPSTIHGAQILHVSVPGVTGVDPHGIVRIEKLGTAEGYSMKVYGQVRETSWDNPAYKNGTHLPAWRMQTAYDILWGAWRDRIVDADLDYQRVINLVSHYDHVVSTVPLPQLVKNLEWDLFESQIVYIWSDPKKLSTTVHWIQYNGLGRVSYYRTSCLWGYSSFEYGVAQAPDGAVRVVKPLDIVGGDATREELTPLGVTLAGRYGEWRKGRLVHDSIQVTRELIEA